PTRKIRLRENKHSITGALGRQFDLMCRKPLDPNGICTVNGTRRDRYLLFHESGLSDVSRRKELERILEIARNLGRMRYPGRPHRARILPDRKLRCSHLAVTVGR